MICGIDEAGRGPVIGPMIIAGVQIDNEERLRGFDIRDSKKCSPEERKRLAEIIREKAISVYILKLDAEEIDRLRKMFTMNEIELETFSRVMKTLKSDVYYVDSADVDEERFGKELEKRLNFDAKIISVHKADDRFLVAAAASIIAKVERDEIIKNIEEELRKKLDIPLGSGYPSDPRTINFIKEWIKKYKSLPPHIRKSWVTVRRLSYEQTKLW